MAFVVLVICNRQSSMARKVGANVERRKASLLRVILGGGPAENITSVIVYRTYFWNKNKFRAFIFPA